MTRNPSPPPAVMDGEGLSLIYKRIKPKNGIMAVLPGENNSQFFPEGTEIPSDLMDSAEQISGRMECTENGPQFVAGKVMVCSFLGLGTFFQKLLHYKNISYLCLVLLQVSKCFVLVQTFWARS